MNAELIFRKSSEKRKNATFSIAESYVKRALIKRLLRHVHCTGNIKLLIEDLEHAAIRYDVRMPSSPVMIKKDDSAGPYSFSVEQAKRDDYYFELECYDEQ